VDIHHKSQCLCLVEIFFDASSVTQHCACVCDADRAERMGTDGLQIRPYIGLYGSLSVGDDWRIRTVHVYKIVGRCVQYYRLHAVDGKILSYLLI